MTTPMATNCFLFIVRSFLLSILFTLRLFIKQLFKKNVLIRKKSKFYFGVPNKVLIFVAVKTKKDNENNVRKYILVVAPFTTPTVVREQCSYVYM